MKEKKKVLRSELKERLSRLDQKVYQAKSSIIHTVLFQQPDWLKAETIGVTLSQFPEVDTFAIIQKGWEEGKRMVVPKCYPEQKKMIFYEITSFEQVEKGYFNLFEPLPEKTKAVQKEDIDLLIVPGLGYSKDGYRIGFGGGYYDRFLKDFKGITLSLAFREQLVDEVPAETHDIPVQKLISEEGVIICYDR